MRRSRRAVGWLTSERGRRVLGWTTAVFLTLSAVLSLVVVPADAEQGVVQRLMYVHVPTAWIAYLAFTVVFAASVAYLRTRRTRWDRLAEASAEIGVVFTALTIVLGAIWGRPTWGVWWTWDPRLTTTAILFLIYLGYLAVRRLPENPMRAYRWAAVIGVLGFLDVPVVHLSVLWWRGLHQPPSVLRVQGPVVAPSMLFALGFAVAAFTLAYLWLLVTRMHLRRVEERARSDLLRAPVARVGKEVPN
ncbi:cytochrome c biogenesis protein CcsA [Amycolatopsis silviterrae]|uniref:Heme exporter protein C n=1 Tax=Amycolatopsis silviterrae TaxID=1656914 RepID=A0ABW5HHS0_9PSEU